MAINGYGLASGAKQRLKYVGAAGTSHAISYTMAKLVGHPTDVILNGMIRVNRTTVDIVEVIPFP